MAKNVWVNLDRVAIGNILKSDKLAALLLDIADSVNSAAGNKYETRTRQRSTRVISEVLDNRSGAMYRESATGDMARALGSVKK